MTVCSVLVVEDHPAMRDMLVESLRRALADRDGETAAAEVHAASNAEEALEVLAAHRVDVVLLDWFMPVHNGGWFLERLAEKRGLDGVSPRVCVLSSVTSPTVLERALELGATGILSKTATSGRQLVDALLRVQAGEKVIGPGVDVPDRC